MSVANVLDGDDKILKRFLPIVTDGPTGPTGPSQGPDGPTGPTGPAGGTGPTGPRGYTGTDFTDLQYAHFYSNPPSTSVGLLGGQAILLNGALGGAGQPPNPTSGISKNDSAFSPLVIPGAQASAGSEIRIDKAGIYNISFTASLAAFNSNNAAGTVGIALASSYTSGGEVQLDYTISGNNLYTYNSNVPNLRNFAGSFIFNIPQANTYFMLVAVQLVDGYPFYGGSSSPYITNLSNVSLVINQIA